MQNVFISCDWHLWSEQPNTSHPYRTNYANGKIADHFTEGMTDNDLWLYLGDLCDPDAANEDLLRAIIKSIPGTKILIRGNHDTASEQWYKSLGFNDVVDRVRIHDLVFSHKPVPIKDTELNIHGHLHTEKMTGWSPRHINAYVTNWADGPVTLEDVLDNAMAQRLDIGELNFDHINEKLQQYLSHPDPCYDVLDLSDEFSLAPVQESVGANTMFEICTLAAELGEWDYGVWTGTKLIPNPKDSDYDKYVTMKKWDIERVHGGTCWDYVPYEAQQFRQRWPKVDIHCWSIYFEDHKNSPSHSFLTFKFGTNKWMLFEASDKMHRGIWYGDNEKEIVSQCFLWLAEHNKINIKKTKAWATKYDALNNKWFGIKPQRYMDLLTDTVEEWKIDDDAELIRYDTPVAIDEACKNQTEARKFVRDVSNLAKKYDANYFIVTDGASGIHNNGNEAVKHARKCHEKWERSHGEDPDEDWSNQKLDEAAMASSNVWYHVVPKGTDVSKGLWSPQYMYDHGKKKLATSAMEKYRDRMVHGWDIYKQRKPESLSTEEMLAGLNHQRGPDGSKRIYMFRYSPTADLGPNMAKTLAGKDIYAVDLTKVPKAKIYWGTEGSSPDGKELNAAYYQTVTPKQYFAKYDDNADMLFAALNHIGVATPDGSIPAEALTKVDPSNPVNEVLMGDTDMSRYFEADDREYKDKARKAEQNVAGDHIAAMDESDIKTLDWLLGSIEEDIREMKALQLAQYKDLVNEASKVARVIDPN